MIQQQDTCPFTYVVPPVEEYFFTDASMSRITLGGTYGFVYQNQDLNIKDRFVGYSVISNIHYLECKAIYFCLCYIYWLPERDLYTKYYIFTDSSTCYHLFKCLNNKKPLKDQKKQHRLYRQVEEMVMLYNLLIQEGADINIVDVKGHCVDPREQRRYLHKNGFTFDMYYAELITKGNSQIDGFVGEVNRNKNQYPYLLYDN